VKQKLLELFLSIFLHVLLYISHLPQTSSAKHCIPCTDIRDAIPRGVQQGKHWLEIYLKDRTILTIGFSTKESMKQWKEVLKKCNTMPKISGWIRDSNMIEKQELLGCGAYGKVWKGTMSGTPVAIKEMYNATRTESIENEILVLGEIHNPYCLRLLGVYKDDKNQDRYYLITEFVDQGDLSQVIKENKGHKIPELTKLKILRDVARGITFLHENQIIHRDIKADNCLVRSISPDACQFALVGDFGISKLMRQFESQQQTVGIGTPVYMAPECFTSSYTCAIDVYSFGVVMNELFSEERPWCHVETEFTSEIIGLVEEKQRPRKNFTKEQYPHFDAISKIIDDCWEHDQQKRPPMRKILDAIDDIISTIEIEKTNTDPFLRKGASQSAVLADDTSPVISHTRPSSQVLRRPVSFSEADVSGHRIPKNVAHSPYATFQTSNISPDRDRTLSDPDVLETTTPQKWHSPTIQPSEESPLYTSFNPAYLSHIPPVTEEIEKTPSYTSEEKSDTVQPSYTSEENLEVDKEVLGSIRYADRPFKLTFNEVETQPPPVTPVTPATPATPVTVAPAAYSTVNISNNSADLPEYLKGLTPDYLKTTNTPPSSPSPTTNTPGNVPKYMTGGYYN